MRRPVGWFQTSAAPPAREYPTSSARHPLHSGRLLRHLARVAPVVYGPQATSDGRSNTDSTLSTSQVTHADLFFGTRSKTILLVTQHGTSGH